MFRWGEEQINQLLSDLYRNYLTHLKMGDTELPYYIGMMTTYHNQNGDLDLVDGQQRFTVMMLIGIVFNDEYWHSFLKEGGKSRLSFFARPDSAQFLEINIDRGEVNSRLSSLGDNKKMSDGIRCIRSFLQKKELDDSFSSQKFSKYIFENLTFFIAELPEKYKSSELNKYFEAMNSAGKGLENFEILKVDLLKNRKLDKRLLISIWDMVSKMDNRLHAYWNTPSSDNYDIYTDKTRLLGSIKKCRDMLISGDYSGLNDVTGLLIGEQKIEDTNSPSLLDIEAKEINFSSRDYEQERGLMKFAEFLLFVLKKHYKDYDTSDYYNPSHLLERFQRMTGGKVIEDGDEIEYPSAPDSEILRFYVELLYYRLILDYYFIRVKGRNETRIYSTLLTSGDTKNSAPNENPSIKLVMYQSMLMVSTTWHIWLNPAINWIEEHFDTNSEDFLEYLKSLDNMMNPEIPASLRYDDCQARYWYWRLDYYLWEKYKFNSEDGENKTEIDKKIDHAYRSYKFRANRSIEHFHPQNETNYSDKWGDDVNVFGNLAMISPEFNSTQSNDDFADKMSRIENRLNVGITESLKLLEMFRIARKNGEWKFDDAKEHEIAMLEILTNSYL